MRKKKKTMRTKQQGKKKKKNRNQNRTNLVQGRRQSRPKTFKKLEHNTGVLSYAYSLTNSCEKIFEGYQVGSDEYIMYLINIIGENL